MGIEKRERRHRRQKKRTTTCDSPDGWNYPTSFGLATVRKIITDHLLTQATRAKSPCVAVPKMEFDS